jgi:glycosyltransferase involved in cell wall biosynthesis
MVCTIHHPHVPLLRDHYLQNNQVSYVSLSEYQRAREHPLQTSVIYHGIDTAAYEFVDQKEPYLAWLGRICPLKGTHLAIQVARSMAIPLKLAGDVQPRHRQYFEEAVKPHIDGEFIQYLGEVDMAGKCELLGKSVALLFPVDWDEPFGLVMVEAMACGTPVIALGRGAVAEVVDDGITGFVCESVDQMQQRILDALKLDPQSIRSHATRRFSGTRMAADYLAQYETLLAKNCGN